MISSTEIAAILGSQNAMFLGTAQYAQQISTQMPPAYQGAGTIGGYGWQGGPQQSFPQMPGMGHQQPGFSYNSSAYGYGPGSQAGGAGVAALGAGARGAFGGLGVMAGMGMLGNAAGFALDPFKGGMAGFSAARGMGMGFTGALGVGAMAAAPAFLGGQMVQHGISSMVHGAQEQAGIERSLGQFNFSNSGSRTGRGFSRSDAMGIGDMVRQMAHLPEMMTSVSELTRIMDKLGQSGAMNGARDAADFGRKFKDSIKTLKEVSKVLGTTMEDAASFFGESRKSGFYSQRDIVQNAMHRQVGNALTGMNNHQMNALQQFGGQLSHSHGGSRRTGAQHLTRTAMQLGAMQRMGLLTDEQVIEHTGKGGAEGIQEMAGELGGAAHSMASSNVGRIMSMALAEQKDGRFTGKMDQDLVAQVRSGALGQSDLMRLARQKTSSRASKLSWVANQDRLRSEMAGSVGVEGMAAQTAKLLGDRGWDNPDAQNIVMQRFGLSERQAHLVQKVGRNLSAAQEEMGFTEAAEARRIAQQSNAMENSPGAIVRKVKTKIGNVLTAPFERLGASIRDSIARKTDSFVDELTGHYAAQLTRGASEVVMGGHSGNQEYAGVIQRARQGGARQGVGRDYSTGVLGGMVRRAGDIHVDGESQYRLASQLGGGRVTSGSDRASMLASGVDIYETQTLRSGGRRHGRNGWGSGEGADAGFTGLSASNRAAAIGDLQSFASGGSSGGFEASIAHARAMADPAALARVQGTLGKNWFDPSMSGKSQSDRMQMLISKLDKGDLAAIGGGRGRQASAVLAAAQLSGTDISGMAGGLISDMGGGRKDIDLRTAADRQKASHQRAEDAFRDGKFGAEFKDVEGAISGGGAMMQLMVGKNGIFGGGGDRIGKMLESGRGLSAAQLKELGITGGGAINTKTLEAAVHARRGLGGKKADALVGEMFAADVDLAGAQERDTLRVEGEGQAARLNARSGLVDKLSSGKQKGPAAAALAGLREFSSFATDQNVSGARALSMVTNLANLDDAGADVKDMAGSSARALGLAGKRIRGVKAGMRGSEIDAMGLHGDQYIDSKTGKVAADKLDKLKQDLALAAVGRVTGLNAKGGKGGVGAANEAAVTKNIADLAMWTGKLAQAVGGMTEKPEK